MKAVAGAGPRWAGLGSKLGGTQAGMLEEVGATVGWGAAWAGAGQLFGFWGLGSDRAVITAVPPETLMVNSGGFPGGGIPQSFTRAWAYQEIHWCEGGRGSEHSAPPWI